jgi:predicted PurR-regulated permease PerM
LKKPQTPIGGRPSSSHKQKHRVETMQFNDDDNIDQNLNHTNENEDENQQQKEIKPSSTQDVNNKSRKIRQLQTKLSRQEEETKKKFDELQSKQSRLENAIKLLVKQTTTYNKRRQPTNDHIEGNIIHLFIFFFFLLLLLFEYKKISIHLLSMLLFNHQEKLISKKNPINNKNHY